VLGGPSLRILYTIEMSDRGYGLNFKALGHQWYWRYEYSYQAFQDYKFFSKFFNFKEESVTFDSYMKRMEDLIEEGGGQYRLLEVDNRVVCPSTKNVRVIIGSEDVMHC